MKSLLVFLVLCVTLSYADYYLGKQGESCSSACNRMGLNCNPHIVTDNTDDLFVQLGVSCIADNRSWWAEDQPSYVSDPSDGNYGRCLGWTDVPGGVFCGAFYDTVERLCRCDEPSSDEQTFGFGLSSSYISTDERIIFQHWLADGDYGVMTHFWMTIGGGYEDGMIIRYYVDGEDEASIEYTPSMACGVGYYDTQAPWGITWFGKGAADGSYFNNFKIPFQKNIIVTAQHEYGTYGGFYMIVRGATNLPISISGLALPTTSKLLLIKYNASADPVEYVTFANISSGSGMMFMHTLQVDSDNLNFLEGCYHMYTGSQEFPGTVLSTGTEDYYDSGWYFNAGEFHLPTAGYTHYGTDDDGRVYWFHEMDPLLFSDGFRFVWRNGDSNDPSGQKCMMESGGTVVGSPSISNILAYTWVYTW